MATPAKAPAAIKTPAKKPARPAAAKVANIDVVTPVAKAIPAAVDKPKKPVKAADTDKQAKARKPKLVRDSFTIPKDEYQVIDALKARSAKLGQPMKKSELLRAGIKLLNSLADSAFKQALTEVPAIKTGRPKKSK